VGKGTDSFTGSIAGSVSFGLEALLMVDAFQHGSEKTFPRARESGESVQYELRDLGVVNQSGFAQHPEVARDRGLWLSENDLQVGHEQRASGKTIEDPEPGRLGQRDQ